MTDPIKLSVGEPDFPTPEHVKDAARQAIRDNITRYTPQPGFDDLRDEVLVFLPYWFATLEQVRRAGGRAVLLPTRPEDDFQPDLGAIRAAVTGATRAIVINSPCNPTGAVYSRQLLEGIAALAVQHDFLVISDEVYEHILFDGAEHVSIASLGPEVAARTVTVNSVSKTHAMTGWRIGYAAMPVALAEKVTLLQSVSTSGPCAIAQRAALAALAGDQSHVPKMAAAYAQRRAHVLNRVSRIDGFSCRAPRGTFYLFVDISGLIGKAIKGETVKDADGFVDIVRRRANVLLLSGSGFGAPTHFRLSFAAPLDTLQEAMARIERLLEERAT